VDRSGPGHLNQTLTSESRFRHIPELDGLRGSAVLLVIAGHTLVFRLGRAATWGQLAALGVLIFFVLSGFLITGLLCFEERRFGKISLKNFYLRRAFRILPAFSVFIVTVSLLVSVRLVTDTPWRTVAASVLYVRNLFGRGQTLGHLWSLSLEEQFYALWPVVFGLAGRRRILVPTLGAIAGISAWRFAGIYLKIYNYEHGIFYLRPDFRMDSILVGCALALYFDRETPHRNHIRLLSRWATHPIWTIPVLLVWTLFCEIPSFRPIFLTVQTILVCSLVFNLIAYPGSGLGKILRQRWVRLVGLISYSLYLWQQLFLVPNEPSWGLIRQLPYCLVFAAIAASLSYLFVERPFLELKRKFARA
jgi:peptidoglycan/LPS O-acetylase OafA/YrhL